MLCGHTVGGTTYYQIPGNYSAGYIVLPFLPQQRVQFVPRVTQPHLRALPTQRLESSWLPRYTSTRQQGRILKLLPNAVKRIGWKS